ncbi:hypothetical protein [Allofournierella massiliensis]|uniref:Uncharacterized protein n=1 Tax=Allofournierella massiliensis TaxID=1650663 RepID=A0ABT7UQX3_9FIRM|nr:hypothetical protein [Fournierella massiliensis]MDM8201286.1 hypothetical protein [Fournierella massiliensis]
MLALFLLAACAAVFARQVLLCRGALESIPMLLEYPELGETPPLTLEVFQRRVGEKQRTAPPGRESWRWSCPPERSR